MSLAAEIEHELDRILNYNSQRNFNNSKTCRFYDIPQFKSISLIESFESVRSQKMNNSSSGRPQNSGSTGPSAIGTTGTATEHETTENSVIHELPNVYGKQRSIPHPTEKIIDNHMHFWEHLKLENNLIKQCLAECLGTFFLVFIGTSSIAQNIIFDTKSFLSLNISWSIGLLLGIVVSSSVSGSHLNPAITIARMTTHNFSKRIGFFFILSQSIGSYLGAVATFWVYFHSIHTYDPTLTTTQGIFATFPGENVSISSAFTQEFLATAIFVLASYAISDERNVDNNNENYGNSPLQVAFFMSLVLLGIGTSMGYQTGYAINPARDLLARFFSYNAGYGSKVFYIPINNINYRGLSKFYWWVPIFGPILGGIFGAYLYLILVGAHFDQIEIESEPTENAVPPPKRVKNISKIGSINYEDNWPTVPIPAARSNQNHIRYNRLKKEKVGDMSSEVPTSYQNDMISNVSSIIEDANPVRERKGSMIEHLRNVLRHHGKV